MLIPNHLLRLVSTNRNMAAGLDENLCFWKEKQLEDFSIGS